MINLNDYIDRLPMAFRTRDNTKVWVLSKHPTQNDMFFIYNNYKDYSVFSDGKYFIDSEHLNDIISEWQDEPVHDPKTGNISINGETVAHDLVMRKNSRTAPPELTPELLEDIKKGVKAWEVLTHMANKNWEESLMFRVGLTECGVEWKTPQINSEA